MLQLKVGSQGIRGKVNEGLSLNLVIDMTSAFGTWLDGKAVVVARDTRPSSLFISHAVFSALCSCGCEVIDVGICPTAVVQYIANKMDAKGAISITASHNDATWNGLKLFGEKGQVLTKSEGKEVLDLWQQGDYIKAPYNKLGAVKKIQDFMDSYLEHIESFVDVDKIASAGLRVAVDACNGSGAIILPKLCKRLGVELVPVNCEPTGIFPHSPDPSKNNMAQVSAIIKPVGAHVGFGLSSDCERVSVVSDRAEALGTGATLPLIAQEILADVKSPSTVIATTATDSRIDQVAKRHGAKVVRSGVGIQSVIEDMEVENAILGGEGSGGIALAPVHLAFDGLAVIVRLLQSVALHKNSHLLSDNLPNVHVRSAIVPCEVGSGYSAVERIREQAKGKVIDLDGVRVEMDDGWYFVRVSHTEPVIRIICESSSEQQADDLIRLLQQNMRMAIWD